MTKRMREGHGREALTGSFVAIMHLANGQDGWAAGYVACRLCRGYSTLLKANNIACKPHGSSAIKRYALAFGWFLVTPVSWGVDLCNMICAM